MAEQDRTQSRAKQPISRHPLFPATVALWFGALFGLGSLALRPALLESIVLAGGIDTLIPAAAPPLGTTARILLALTMAGLGGLLGAFVARRIARPKPVVRERRRSAAAVRESVGEFGQATLAQSLEEEGRLGKGQLSGGDALNSASRRRALAIVEEAARFDVHERAPLPGGEPQILNVAEFGFESFDAADEPEAVSASLSDQDALDLSQFSADGAGASPEPTVPAEAPHQLAEQPVAILDEYEPKDGKPDFTPPWDRPVAGNSDEEAPAMAEPIGAVDAEKPFEQPDRSAPFSRPFGQPFESLEEDAEPETSSGEFLDARDEAPHHDGEDAVAAAPAEDSVKSIDDFRPADPSAAERIASADLSELSHVELLERLALSLERRRQAAAALPLPVAAPEKAQPAPAALAVPEAYAVPAEDEADEPDHTGETQEPESAPFVGGPFAPPPVTVPAALRPVGLDDEDDFDLLPSFVPPRHIALSPRDKPEFTVDGTRSDNDVESPRDEAAGTDRTIAAPQVYQSEDEDELDEEAQILKDGYSSLLDLKRQAPAKLSHEKQPFVRIEEPETSDSQVEPVVVFPGQEPQTGAPFAASVPDRKDETAGNDSPDGDAGTEAAEARRFDEPEARDSEETERALRAALANLQRISGAA